MVKIKGLPELRRKLEKLRTNTAPKVQAAMEVAAERICDRMRSLVPVDHGDLRNSIGWTWGPPPKGSVSVSMKARPGRSNRRRSKGGQGEMSLTIYAGDEKAFYARWVEFGTAPHEQEGRFKGTMSPGTVAQPFFFPAYRSNEKAVVAAVRKAIREAVREAVRG